RDRNVDQPKPASAARNRAHRTTPHAMPVRIIRLATCRLGALGCETPRAIQRTTDTSIAIMIAATNARHQNFRVICSLVAWVIQLTERLVRRHRNETRRLSLMRAFGVNSGRRTEDTPRRRQRFTQHAFDGVPLITFAIRLCDGAVPYGTSK